MSEDIFHLGIKALIRNKHGEILLLHVDPAAVGGKEYWDIPGGRVQRGHGVEETLRREIEEETGIRGRIEAKVDRVFYTYTGQDNETVDKEVHYFLVEAVSGSLKAQEEEIGGVSWHSPEEAWRLQRDMGYGNNDRVLAGAFRLLGIGVDGVG